MRKNVGLYLMIVIVASLVGFFFLPRSEKTEPTYSTSVETKFALLGKARTNLCAGTSFINNKNNGESLQGACCSAMDFHRYAEQVEGLKKYSSIDKIPSNPYDIPVSLAKELLGYQNIGLTEEQQKIYNDAMKLSHEGGPCCCKCWRWYAFDGQAKYLITQHNFNAEQIAEVWDLEDGCGGKGHTGHEGEMEREIFEPSV